MNVAAWGSVLRHEDLLPVLLLRRVALVGTLLAAFAVGGLALWSWWPWR